MLKIHTADGQTHLVDLADANQARELTARLSREDFQATINGVSLYKRYPFPKCASCGASAGRETGVQYSVTRPDGVRRVFVHAECVPTNGRVKGGERVTVFADDMRLALMAHA